MSDSESDSSLDEHLQSTISLQNVDSFYRRENLKLDNDEEEEDTKIDGDSEQADSEGEPDEYFDFSNILKSQQVLTDLSDRNSSVSVSKLERSVGKSDELDVSELLAIGENDAADDSVKSDDDENDVVRTDDAYPSECVKITIRLPGCAKRTKRRADFDAELRRQLNAVKRANQVHLHKVHLLCLIAHGTYLNRVLNGDDLLSVASSVVPSEKFYPPKRADIFYLERLVGWFAKKFKVAPKPNPASDDLTERLICQFADGETASVKDLVLMFVCVARILGLKCRLVMSLQPSPLKPPTADLINDNSKTTKNNGESSNVKSLKRSQPNAATSENKVSSIKKIKTAKKTTAVETDSSSPNRGKRNGNRETSKSARASNTDDKRRRATAGAGSDAVKRPNGKASRSESGGGEKNSTPEKREKVDSWAEVFVESEEKWISVNVPKAKVHCINDLYNGCTRPVCYILGWNNDLTVKDLTRRYAPQWMTVTQKMRVDNVWWDETLSPWRPKRTADEIEEDYDLDKILQDKPLPTSISEYKSHPLYALKRHLLKFEAIYPPDAPTLGFIKNEPVYSRLCVHELHARETWLRRAKLVRRNETPYKIVKARPKIDKASGTTIKDLPLELFGHWQVDDYIAPPAVDGKVPRNDYGNVELYKPSMLPPGTVHLQVPGLNRVARKLDIDCAPAVVGWDFHGGGSHPKFDGFIVCEEFKDVLLDAWNKDIDESAKRHRDKIEQRVYRNWKRLIRGLQIRERLEVRYKFGLMPSNSGNDVETKLMKRKHK